MKVIKILLFKWPIYLCLFLYFSCGIILLKHSNHTLHSQKCNDQGKTNINSIQVFALFPVWCKRMPPTRRPSHQVYCFPHKDFTHLSILKGNKRTKGNVFL